MSAVGRFKMSHKHLYTALVKGQYLAM